MRYLYSDNGTNFRGADREMRKAIVEWQKSDPEGYLKMNIEWKLFTHPYGHHRGGVWESVVKQAKRLLAVIFDGRLMSFENLRTIMTNCEGVLNRRPLTKASDDVNDFTPLTPMHALCPSLAPQPEGMLMDLPEPSGTLLRATWTENLNLVQSFRRRFLREYVPLLQQRQKWTTTRDNLKVGQLVLLVEETKKRRDWRMGVVDKVEGTPPHIRGAYVRVIRDKAVKKTAKDRYELPKPTTYYRDRTSIVVLEADLE